MTILVYMMLVAIGAGGALILQELFSRRRVRMELGCLSLTRRRMQTIHIGDDVVVQVVDTGLNRVQLTVQAPKDVRIVRGELLERAGTEGAP